MCGICGFANYRNEDLLKGMASRLAHRGPDEDGFFTDGEKAFLGMRRLKIIDLSTGAQPISRPVRGIAEPNVISGYLNLFLIQ